MDQEAGPGPAGGSRPSGVEVPEAMFRRLSSYLDQAAANLNAADGLRRGRLLQAWPEAVGPALARQAAPAGIQGDTLLLVCKASAWSQEILLRQGEILNRLNRLLGDPPLRRLRCRVGRPDPPPAASQAPTEETVRWESIPLDVQARERVDRLAGEVQDPELERRVRRLLVQLERRRSRDVASGLRPCPLCGALCARPPCRTCRREARSRRRQRILQRFGQEPWLTRPDLLEVFPNLSVEEFAEIRNSLRSLLIQDVWKGLRALPEGSPLPDDLRALVLELATLSASLPPHQLQPKHLQATLPRTLARAYLDNRAPGPWTHGTDTGSDQRQESRTGRPQDRPPPGPGAPGSDTGSDNIQGSQNRRPRHRQPPGPRLPRTDTRSDLR